MQPRVIDLSHHNTIKDFGPAVAAGIWGVIHKATQGAVYFDPDYAGRRQAAQAAGLLWGAYHFNTGDPIKKQVDWFLARARPDDHTLLVLDYEDNRLSQMNAEQAVDFLHNIELKIGRKAAIYSGIRLKETIGQLSADERVYLASHRLWLSQYGPKAKLPDGWPTWWLWQFTDGQVGPQPHSIPGIQSPTDLSTYLGTKDQLKAEWQ